jgi:uncharacterized phage infection (PIP) family protein YhgE
MAAQGAPPSGAPPPGGPAQGPSNKPVNVLKFIARSGFVIHEELTALKQVNRELRTTAREAGTRIASIRASVKGAQDALQQWDKERRGIGLKNVQEYKRHLKDYKGTLDKTEYKRIAKGLGDVLDKLEEQLRELQNKARKKAEELRQISKILKKEADELGITKEEALKLDSELLEAAKQLDELADKINRNIKEIHEEKMRSV